MPACLNPNARPNTIHNYETNACPSVDGRRTSNTRSCIARLLKHLFSVGSSGYNCQQPLLQSKAHPRMPQSPTTEDDMGRGRRGSEYLFLPLLGSGIRLPSCRFLFCLEVTEAKKKTDYGQGG